MVREHDSSTWDEFDKIVAWMAIEEMNARTVACVLDVLPMCSPLMIWKVTE